VSVRSDGSVRIWNGTTRKLVQNGNSGHTKGNISYRIAAVENPALSTKRWSIPPNSHLKLILSINPY
jgi:hypothetical protein